MRVDRDVNAFVIVEGRKKERYFCFFVDSSSACWTSDRSGKYVRRYATQERAMRAMRDIGELKRRAHMRRAHLAEPQEKK
jgi:hypothetical protein